ncbi:Phage terminase-like protein, large subunit, contains N-terminal HTH domain [Streptomyces sp. DI166]|uniref:terminase large subunit n=1 Tax=Streptomyces sp. DI166 TaxID=1839783 RepID=UPI0007F4B219|nr:terminase TerL endonuclease subunit [Streptomyces sp. DI166]SBT89387.1 Phage terminase-like protein, large subunit, contains N-terminal HTH domain [Streptomyces sp. DI166]
MATGATTRRPARSKAATRPARTTRRRVLKVDHHKRWRPASRRGGVCGYTLDGKTCTKRGAHYCEPRADRVVRFFAELLVHPAGAFAGTRFELAAWQEHEIIRPLFGEVVWSEQWGRYVRRYTRATIVMARKNGKSALLSGIALYMLCGDGEESAEVYCAAANTRQAGKVFEPAVKMVRKSPVLSKRLKHIKNVRRLVDEKTGSHYEAIPSDADNELGHSPHCFILDEVLSQPDDTLWKAMVTGAGARTQPLMLAITTETTDQASFGADFIDEADRVMEDPARTPHHFAFVRKMPRTVEDLERLARLFPARPELPVSTDPWDERNWAWPNPALGTFLAVQALREDAIEARTDRSKFNGFLQFRLNQRVSQVTRWLSMDLWDARAGEIAPTPDWVRGRLKGERCWGGLDLSSKLDMTSLAWVFPDGSVLWRFWLPESMIEPLDEHTNGRISQWVEAGWITATEGDTIDYERIYDDVAQDHKDFRIVDITYDKWSGEPVRQAIVKRTRLKMVESDTTYLRMTAPMGELMRRLKADEIRHFGNPVARWMADVVEKKSPRDDPDRQRPVKPDRDKTGKRIDGIPALLFALDGAMRGLPKPSVYESQGMAL